MNQGDIDTVMRELDGTRISRGSAPMQSSGVLLQSAGQVPWGIGNAPVSLLGGGNAKNSPVR